MEGTGAREQLVVSEMTYRVGESEFGLRRGVSGKYRYEPFVENAEFEFRRYQGRPWKIASPVKCYGSQTLYEPTIRMPGFLLTLNLNWSRGFKTFTILALCAPFQNESTLGLVFSLWTWARQESRSGRDIGFTATG